MRARVPNPDSGACELRFLLTPEQARAPVCVVLRAIDGAGKLSAGGPELCFDPARTAAISPAAARARAGAGTMAAGAWILVPWCAVLAVAAQAATRAIAVNDRHEDRVSRPSRPALRPRSATGR